MIIQILFLISDIDIIIVLYFQLPEIRNLVAELGEEKAFSFVFEGSDFLKEIIERSGQTDPVKNPELFRECCWNVESRG